MIVKFFATYRDITGTKEMNMPPPSDVGELLSELSEKFGKDMRAKLIDEESGGLGRDALVLVNGRHIDHLRGVRTGLSDADTVAVFPLVAGG